MIAAPRSALILGWTLFVEGRTIALPSIAPLLPALALARAVQLGLSRRILSALRLRSGVGLSTVATAFRAALLDFAVSRFFAALAGLLCTIVARALGSRTLLGGGYRVIEEAALAEGALVAPFAPPAATRALFRSVFTLWGVRHGRVRVWLGLRGI